MNKIEKCRAKIDKAIEGIDDFIWNKEYDNYSISLDTLLGFKKYFEAIRENLDNQEIEAKTKETYVSHIIVDSWPYEISISEILIAAERSYIEL